VLSVRDAQLRKDVAYLRRKERVYPFRPWWLLRRSSASGYRRRTGADNGAMNTGTRQRPNCRRNRDVSPLYRLSLHR